MRNIPRNPGGAVRVSGAAQRRGCEKGTGRHLTINVVPEKIWHSSAPTSILPKSLRGRIEGGLLKLEVAPGFLYGRVNRQEVLAKFSAAASELCGRDIRAVVSELSDDAAPEPQKRSLEDLRGFKEVRFIDR